MLSERFIPVRFTSLKGVDLARFSFDYDQTFMAMAQTAEGRTLFRWSSRDDDSEAINDLTKLLEKPWPASGKPESLAPPRTLRDDAQFAATKRAGEACYHCHYAHDAEIARQRSAGTFEKSQLFRFPPPETIGLTLDGAASPRLRAVAPGSAAQKAGVRPGDVLVTVGGQRVHTAQDVRFALDGINDAVALTLERAGLRRSVSLALPGGWRVYDISDRPSQGGVPPVLGIWEQPLKRREKRALGIREGQLALRISFLFPGEKWKPAQGELRLGDVVLEVDGVALPAMTPRQFHTWIRLNREVGHTLTLTVLRGGKRRKITVVGIDPGEL